MCCCHKTISGLTTSFSFARKAQPPRECSFQGSKQKGNSRRKKYTNIIYTNNTTTTTRTTTTTTTDTTGNINLTSTLNHIKA